MSLFTDRRDAGRQLGRKLADLNLADPAVLALPRGGVPVGYEIACALDAPLDVVIARKVGAPAQQEFAIGAVAEGGAQVIDARIVSRLGIDEQALDSLVQRQLENLRDAVERYRGGRPLELLHGRTAVVVDDGLATGATAAAALRAVRGLEPARLVLAVPVGARDSLDRMRAVAEDVVCLECPRPFGAVGRWYRDFGQVPDSEVQALLARRRSLPHDPATALNTTAHDTATGLTSAGSAPPTSSSNGSA